MARACQCAGPRGWRRPGRRGSRHGRRSRPRDGGGRPRTPPREDGAHRRHGAPRGRHPKRLCGAAARAGWGTTRPTSPAYAGSTVGAAAARTPPPQLPSADCQPPVTSRVGLAPLATRSAAAWTPAAAVAATAAAIAPAAVRPRRRFDSPPAPAVVDAAEAAARAAGGAGWRPLVRSEARVWASAPAARMVRAAVEACWRESGLAAAMVLRPVAAGRAGKGLGGGQGGGRGRGGRGVGAVGATADAVGSGRKRRRLPSARWAPTAAPRWRPTGVVETRLPWRRGRSGSSDARRRRRQKEQQKRRGQRRWRRE